MNPQPPEEGPGNPWLLIAAGIACWLLVALAYVLFKILVGTP